MMRYCILSRLCRIFQVELEDNIVIRPRLSRQTKHTYCEKKAVTERNNTKSLQLQLSLSVASVSIRGAPGRSAVYCNSCWRIKCNWGCTQTRSNKLLLVDLSVIHVVVELLLLLWSRKALDLAHGNRTKNLAIALAPHNLRASRSRPKCNSLSIGHPKSTQMHAVFHHHLCVSWWHNTRLDLISRIHQLAVALKPSRNPNKLEHLSYVATV